MAISDGTPPKQKGQSVTQSHSGPVLSSESLPYKHTNPGTASSYAWSVSGVKVCSIIPVNEFGTLRTGAPPAGLHWTIEKVTARVEWNINTPCNVCGNVLHPTFIIAKWTVGPYSFDSNQWPTLGGYSFTGAQSAITHVYGDGSVDLSYTLEADAYSTCGVIISGPFIQNPCYNSTFVLNGVTKLRAVP